MYCSFGKVAHTNKRESAGTSTPKKEKKKKKREREGREGGGDQIPRFPGVPPIPSTQLPIQVGVGAPTAAGWGGFGPICGPLFV